MANKLNPCKCGNIRPELHSDFYPFEDPHPMNWVMCRKCGYETSVYKTEQEAIEAWNRRVEDNNVH
jgi:Lar family restriction alleviation protein